MSGVTHVPAPDPHQPLREDVRLLGDLLGATLRAHAGDGVFALVEQVRQLTRAARAGDDDAWRRARTLLGALPLGTALPVARAFTQFLQLANVAEQHHRTRRRRDYLRLPQAGAQPGSCAEAFARLIATGIPPPRLHEAVRALRVELVLTAHPTEVSRRTLLRKYGRIARLLARRDRDDLTHPERDACHRALAREVAAIWASDEVRHAQVTPLDEVRAGLIVVEESLWYAVPRYLAALDDALNRTTGQRLPVGSTPIVFGSWMGGDRDGNPSVTPEVTRQAVLLARGLAARLYHREVRRLRDELSMATASAELAARVDHAPEPYRVLLGDVCARLRATRRWIAASRRRQADVPVPPRAFRDAAGLAEPLDCCIRSLRETGYGDIADGRLTDLRRRLDVFGLTLARLDVRQESGRHAAALDAVTRARGLGAYAEWDESQRLEFLSRTIDAADSWTAGLPSVSPEVDDVLDTVRMIARLPADSLGAYVVTMTHAASDVLAVEWLQAHAGVSTPLRVVPLFETADDLHRAPAVIDTLLDSPAHRRRIGTRQEVMVGYSDSAKDVGRFAASRALVDAQERLVAVATRHGVALTLFHGRGGSVGRGGGPTYLALMSQPAGTIDGTLRVTEQGEMVQALFGLPDIAVRTLEVYTTGTLDAWLRPPPAPPDAWRACLDRLADAAAQRYRAVVADNPTFLEYWRHATPVGELGQVRIGSRPARRGQAGGVTAIRAIPWQFGWTQTRLLLGSWLGLDAALAAARDTGDEALLREMYVHWPHLRSLFSLMAMALAKADPAIAAVYDEALVPVTLQPIGRDLRAALQSTVEGLLRVTGQARLLNDTPVLRRSIDVRNPYVDPINLLQVELLRRMRRGDDDPDLHTAFAVTVNGIAAGLRNTG